ncbi:uncharacterized protein CLUP02_06758 [Colletotrichum lupini]|uniref:Uncharacterized protein n=1 Tax=Colletotrichum lupini TaxID=145971 RepID=A0A9Q8SRJ0_9PEZI|nr:uncharacterized protein CLUP02_06758 [Colletotrichum lupini]UQC81272.1 hypothetical protein CLUP02_06758 [Colletotrichum lupini]
MRQFAGQWPVVGPSQKAVEAWSVVCRWRVHTRQFQEGWFGHYLDGSTMVKEDASFGFQSRIANIWNTASLNDLMHADDSNCNATLGNLYASQADQYKANCPGLLQAAPLPPISISKAIMDSAHSLFLSHTKSSTQQQSRDDYIQTSPIAAIY